MERIALDILGPLPESTRGNKYILVLIDCFNKWTEAIAIPDQEAETIVTTFVNEISVDLVHHRSRTKFRIETF